VGKLLFVIGYIYHLTGTIKTLNYCSYFGMCNSVNRKMLLSLNCCYVSCAGRLLQRDLVPSAALSLTSNVTAEVLGKRSAADAMRSLQCIMIAVAIQS
jgi:hypothetical protein